MEYVAKYNIFGLQMMVIRGLEKEYFEIHPFAIFFLRHENAQNCKFSNKNYLLCAWWDFNKKICYACTYNKLNFKFQPYSILSK